MSEEPLDLDVFAGQLHGHPIPAFLAEVRRLRAVVDHTRLSLDEVQQRHARLLQAVEADAECDGLRAENVALWAVADAAHEAAPLITTHTRAEQAVLLRLRAVLAALPPREEEPHGADHP